MKKFENYAASNFNKNWSNLIKRESPLLFIWLYRPKYLQILPTVLINKGFLGKRHS